MKREFTVDRQGKTFVLYAGILDLAHQMGLRSITTDLVQIPSEANNRVAICTATVILERDGIEQRFTGIGDAAPNNVAPAMQTCLIRMAETRAKARALRDAVNIGVAAFEELGEDLAGGDGDAPSRPAVRPTGTRTTSSRAAAPPPAPPAAPVSSALAPADPNGPLTPNQQHAIEALARTKRVEADSYARNAYNLPVSELSQSQAGEIIKRLSKEPAAAR